MTRYVLASAMLPLLISSAGAAVYGTPKACDYYAANPVDDVFASVRLETPTLLMVVTDDKLILGETVCRPLSRSDDRARYDCLAEDGDFIWEVTLIENVPEGTMIFRDEDGELLLRRCSTS